MKKPASLIAALAALLLCLAAPACAKQEKTAAVPKPPVKIINYDIFGNVRVYRNTADPGRTVLLLSDKGWDARMERAARAIADMGAAVVGIDTAHLLQPLRAQSKDCLYQAWVFEGLSKIVQKELGFKRYRLPVVAGFGEGATLAYATFAQAPPKTFSGAVTLGFSPDIAIGKHFCDAFTLKSSTDAKGGETIEPLAEPQGRLIFLQGRTDSRFPLPRAQAYAAKIPGAGLRVLAGAPSPDAPQGWEKDFHAALDEIAPVLRPAAQTVETGDDVSDLPIVELRAKHPCKTMAVIVTGDGGWAGIDKAIGGIFADHGVSVIGLNSLKYFWNGRKPNETARDLQRILTHYGRVWGAERFIVVGYSIGADAMPFMAGRMSEAIKSKLACVAMLGPGTHADLEFHLTNWLSDENVPEGTPMIPEMPKLSKVRVLLFCGSEEEGTLCQNYSAPNVRSNVVPGGHHFNQQYPHIALTILRAAGVPAEK